jgi:hypothetical protein
LADAHANFAVSSVATAPSPATSGTSLVVASGEGSRFPAVPFNAVIAPASATPTPANAEVVRVTARATDTLTITRAQEGSTARTVIVGDRIYAGLTAAHLDQYIPYSAHPLSVNPTLLAQWSTKISTGALSGTNYFFVSGSADVVNTNLNAASLTGEYWGMQNVAANTVTGYTQNWYLEVICQVGGTGPGKTYTITLNPITIAAGVVTVGTAVTGSTCTFTSPAANAFRVAASGNFAQPGGGTGFYAPIVTINTSTPASNVGLFAKLLQFYA